MTSRFVICAIGLQFVLLFNFVTCIYYMSLKLAGALLIEAVKIEFCMKSLSKEDRVIFAACIAVSIYVVALIMFIRI